MPSFPSWFKFVKRNGPALLLALILLVLASKSIALILHNGPGAWTEATWEGSVFYAVSAFLNDGLAATWGLPVYPLDHLTPIELLRKTRVYTHFLPGDSYLVYLLARVFGEG